MALEALFGSENLYGKAIIPRLTMFLGEQTDLYAAYPGDWRTDLGSLPLCSVTTDIFDLRNKIAHGGGLPREWMVQSKRNGMNYTLCYADLLREAATSMLSIACRKILKEGRQETFANKVGLAAYLD